MSDIKIWFPPAPRNPKLAVIHCRPDKTGAFMHRAYEGRKLIDSINLTGILGEDPIEHLRTDPVRTIALWKIQWEPHVY